jgi:hypothetical protein
MSERDSDHYIGRVIIEYGVEHEGDANLFYHEFSRLFSNYIQKVLQRVLEELDEPSMRIQLDSVEIDIGEFTPSSLAEVVPKRIYEQLRKALLDKIGYPGGVKIPSPGVQFSDVVPGRLELIEEFLLTGRVPARASNMQSRVEDLFQDLLREYPGDTIALVRRIARRSMFVAQRIATQFRPSTIELIYRTLQPTYRNYLMDQELRTATAIAKTMKISIDRARHEVRFALVSFLLYNQTPFAPPEFRKNMGEQMVRAFGDKVAPLFEEAAATSSSAASYSADAPESTQQALVAVMQFIRGGMPGSDIPGFVQAWDFLVLNAPQRLAKDLGKLDRGVDIFNKLMTVLPDDSLEQFVLRALPEKANLILEVAAAVGALVGAYAHPNTPILRLSRAVLAALVAHSVKRVDAQGSITAATAVQELAKHFAANKQMPAVIKEALKKQDIPGVSGLKPISQTPEEKAKEAGTWEAAEAAKSAEAAEIGSEPQTPVWEGGDTPEEKRERERLYRSDREFQTEAQLLAEERLEATKADALRLEKELKETLSAAIEAEGVTQEDVEKAEAALDDEAELAKLPPEIRELLKGRAARSAEIKARIQAEAAKVEEAAKAAASKARDTSGDTPYQAEAPVDPLGTIVARLDYVEYFLLTGKHPWWLESPASGSLEMTISSLFKVAGKRLELRLREIIVRTPPRAYPALVERLLGGIGDSQVIQLLQLLQPNIAGIMPAVVRVLKRYHQAPPRQLNYPPFLGDAHHFVWHHLVRFTFDYLSSTPGSAAMVRYVVDGIARALGDPPRVFLKEFRAVVDEMIAKGESGLNPVKSMLPLEGMPLSFDPPTAHPTSEDAVVPIDPETQAYLAEMAIGAQAELDSDPGSIQERFERREQALQAHIAAARERAQRLAEAATANPVPRPKGEGAVVQERLSLEAAERALERADKRLRDAEKALTEAIQRGDTTVAQARLIEAIEGQRVAAEQLEEVKAAILAEQERRAAAESLQGRDQTRPRVLPADAPPADAPPADAPPADAPPADAPPADAPPADAPAADTPDAPKTVAKSNPGEVLYDPSDYDVDLEAGVEPVAPPKEDAQEKVKRPDRRPQEAPAEAPEEMLDPVEVEALREAAAERLNLPDGAAKALVRYYKTAEALVDLFRHYFQHGSLPGNLPIALPRGQFVLLFDYVMEKHPDEFFAMVRRAAANRSSRRRLLDIGESALRTTIQALSPRIAAMLLSYLQSVQKLADSPSAPINRENLLEHALAYAARVQSSMFSPLDYLRNLTLYAQAELRVEPRRLINWLSTKLEETQSGQELAIKQVIKVLKNTMVPDEKKKDAKEKILRPLNEEIYVTNAGLVLLTPFFPQLFNLTKLLLPDRSGFIDDTARHRAIHILQYIVTKEMDAPEEKLTLNKLIVGMPLDQPVVASVELTEEETETIESLLVAACKRWTAIKTENPAFLRAQFLDREGKIKPKSEGWDIFVNQKPYDVLLSKLPWSINPVKLPWIQQKIEIYWR